MVGEHALIGWLTWLTNGGWACFDWLIDLTDKWCVSMLWLIDWLDWQMVGEHALIGWLTWLTNGGWACFDWLIDLTDNWILKFLPRGKSFFRIFAPSRMILVALCQNRMATCTETEIQFQLNFRDKNGHGLSDSHSICKRKAVSNFEIKLNSWSKMHAKFHFFWDSRKIVYWSSWGFGELSESSLRNQPLWSKKIFHDRFIWSWIFHKISIVDEYNCIIPLCWVTLAPPL